MRSVVPGGSDGKTSVCNAGDPGSIPGSGRSPKKEMATHSSTLAWKIPWTEEPGRLQSMGLQRVGHDWATLLTIMRSRPLGFIQAPGAGTFGISEVKRRVKMQTVSFVIHNRLLSITAEFMLMKWMGADWLGNQLGLEVWIYSPTCRPLGRGEGLGVEIYINGQWLIMPSWLYSGGDE